MIELIVWFSVIMGLVISYNICTKNEINKRDLYVLVFGVIFIFSFIRFNIFRGVFMFNPHVVLNSLGLEQYISLEFYSDFEYWYLKWIENFPNNNPLSIYSILENYQYPPLFIWLLRCFRGFEPVVFILCNICNVWVFSQILISLRIFNKKVLCLFSLNPIMILFSYLNWFNSTIVLTPLLISFYCFCVTKPCFKLGLLYLCFSILLKQFLIILVPFYLLHMYFYTHSALYLKRFVIFHLKYGLYVLSILGLFLIPFIFADLETVLDQIIFGGINIPDKFFSSSNLSYPVNFATFFRSIGFSNNFCEFISIILRSWFPFVSIYVLIYLKELLFLKRNSDTIIFRVFKKQTLIIDLIWCITGVLGLNLILYPRGSFKYYLVLFVPFLILCVECIHNEDTRNGKIWIITLCLTLINRQIWLFLLIALLIYYYILNTNEVLDENEEF